MLEEVATDIDGSFEFSPQRDGSYVLRVEAPDYVDWKDERVLLSIASPVQQITVELSAGTRVFGVVRDHRPGTSAQVVFTRRDGQRHSAEVDERTGEYEIKGLAAGGHFVRVETGGRSGWRGRINAGPGREPDLVLGEGADVRYDLDAVDPDLAVVAGRLFVNQSPAAGFEISLSPVREPGARPDRGGRGGGVFRDGVGDDGSFSIDSVPPGHYLLRVRRRGGDRRGRGGSATTYTEELPVAAGSHTDRHIELAIGVLRFAVHDPEGNVPERARISLALDSEVGGLAPDDWRGLPSYRRIDVRRGSAEASDVLVGVYRYSLSVPGFAAVAGSASPATAADQPPIELRLEREDPKPVQKSGQGR